MELELQEAALTGNTQRFLEIYLKNPLLLHRLAIGCPSETPLHVAALRGHINLAVEILRLCPDLAECLDSSGSSPLHLAAAKGCLEIVKLLVRAKPEMCRALNHSGLSPTHLAVIKGRVKVVTELIGGRQDSARVTTDEKETVLHLCVKHCQLEVLKMLIESADEVQDLVNSKDEYGNTILHLAVSYKQLKIVNYLLTSEKVDINARNSNGYTPLDVLTHSRRDVQDWGIADSLQLAGAIKSTAFTSQPNTTKASENENNPSIPSFLRPHDKSGKRLNQDEWLSKKRDALMVVASLLAAMAFQAGVNPPGGLWQEADPKNGHRAGEAIVAYQYPETYKFYLRANTVSFVASLSTILLLISGLPFRRRTFMWMLMGIMWVSITAMAVSYGYAIVAVTPKKDRASLRRTMYVAIPVWCGVMGLLFLGHTIRLMERWLKKKGIDMWDCMRKWCGYSAVKNMNENSNV